MAEESIYKSNHMKSIAEKCSMIILAKLAFLAMESIIKMPLNFNRFGTTIGLILDGVSICFLGKILFNLDFSDLLQGLKPQKSNCIKNMQIGLFYMVIGGALVTALNQISFMIHPEPGKTVDYFLNMLEIENMIRTITGRIIFTKPMVEIVMGICFILLAVALEEIFYRYMLYKVFVVKDSDKILFLVISSVIYGLFHCTSIPSFLTSTVISLGLGIVYIKTQKWIYSFTIYFLWNVLVLWMPHHAIASMKDMSSEVFTSGGATVILSLLLLLISIVHYFRAKRLISQEG